MSTHAYHFVDRWRVEATLTEVADLLSDTNLPRWWPSAYRSVQVIHPGDKDGVGQIGLVHAKGWLPYTIHFTYRATDTYYPHGFALDTWGDLTGHGRWTLEQHGPFVNVTYEWTVYADKPILRTCSFVLKPLFESNHRWTMRRGEESLKLELARRRARTPEERARIPPPPGPVSATPFYLLAATIAMGGLWLFNRLFVIRRRSDE